MMGRIPKPIRLLTDKKTGLSDSWEALGHSEGKESFTHHAFTGKPQKEPNRLDIDHFSAVYGGCPDYSRSL